MFSTYVAEEIVRLCVDVIWRHTCSYVVLPIDMYIYTHIERVIQYISSSHTFSDLSHCLEIYRLGDYRRTVNTSTVRTFLISWGQKTRVEYCYVDLSSWYEIWFAITCIDMNVVLHLSTTIQQFQRQFQLPVSGSTQIDWNAVFNEIQQRGILPAPMWLC